MTAVIQSRSPIRVVHVSFGLDVGGQEKLLVELARHADRSRFEPSFVSLGHRGGLSADIESCGCEVFAMEQPLGFKPGLLFRLVRLFRRLRPSVIHTHDNRSLIFAGTAARSVGVPRIIHTRHGEFFGLSPRQLALTRFVTRWVDRYVCVSRNAAENSLNEGIPRAKVQTIYNGIDVDQFDFVGPNTTGPVVAVCRLRPEKDVANLVRAALLARREQPDFQVQVAGDGPRMAELQQQVRELGLEECVRLLGEVRDVSGLLARSRMIVLPSMSGEGVSVALLEAMARGLPVVTTRVGGNPELVLEGETGLVIPPGDSEALARGLLHIWRDPALARRMGDQGRRRVVETFEVRRMVREYEVLYQERDGAAARTGGPGAVALTGLVDEPRTAEATSEP